MAASGSGDSPNYFKVKAGVPVRWEITAGNSLGCNAAIISNNLFDGLISLTPCRVSVKVITFRKPPDLWIQLYHGMIRGTIDVIK